MTVTLSADPEGTVAIPITKTNQGGATSADYTGVPEDVTFESGDTEKEITFSATQDTLNDDGESVKLALGNLPDGVGAGATSETTVSITDDDGPSVTVSFEQASYTTLEGSSVRVKVKLTADPERTVTIPIEKTNQGGASNADYSGVPESLTFNSGETEKNITFAASADMVDDDSEAVILTFGTLPTGVSEGTTKEAVVSITDDDVPAVTVNFQQATYTVNEGTSITITVTINPDPERTVRIPLTVTNQDGATGHDHSLVPEAITFNPGNLTRVFTFQADQDTDDDDENVKIGFGSLPTGVTAGTRSETIVSIADDDVPPVNVSFEQATYTVAENDSVTIKVKLSAHPERTVIIPVTKANQGGASNSDYSGVPENVTFNSNDTEKTFSFSATTDSDNDDGESVKLGFGANLPTGIAAGTTNETIVSIIDDDVPSVTVSFENRTYTIPESDDSTTTEVQENRVTVKVTLSADPERTVTIPITKANQGGASSSDYSGVPENVTFARGDTEKTFSFSAIEDPVDDDGESVKLAFGTLPTGVSEGTTSETVVSITDDDVPSVTASFEKSTYTVAEGSSVAVKVKLSDAPERTVTIPLSKLPQGTTSTNDYSGVPANVVFNSGDTEKTIPFTATQDKYNDDGESVKLTFGTLPTGVSVGSTVQTVVSITDDDVPSVTISYEQAAYTVAESDDSSTINVQENHVTIKVTLSTDPERTVTIPIIKANRGGASNSDYSGVPATVVFNSGDTEKTITFAAAADDVDDDGESVRLGFGIMPTGVSKTGTTEATVNITDDDTAGVTVNPTSLTALEGEDSPYTVVLDSQPTHAVTVTVNDPTENTDVTAAPASLTFTTSNWRTARTVTASAAQDTGSDDENATVTHTASSTDAKYNGISVDDVDVSVTDDDPTVQVNFEKGSYTVDEGSTVDVKVKLDKDPERTVEITLTKTNQGGATSADYYGVPENVTFNSGDTEKTISFTAAPDSVDDDGESVKLTFGTLPTGVTAGTNTETVVSITDDDVPSVTVSFEQATYTVAEGNSVAVKVELDVAPERTVTIPITTDDQGGTTSTDYSGVPTELTFNSSDTEKRFTFAASPDTDNDDGENVKLSFGTMPPKSPPDPPARRSSTSSTTTYLPSPSASSEPPIP